MQKHKTLRCVLRAGAAVAVLLSVHGCSSESGYTPCALGGSAEADPKCELVKAAVREYAAGNASMDIDQLDRLLAADFEATFVQGNEQLTFNKGDFLEAKARGFLSYLRDYYEIAPEKVEISGDKARVEALLTVSDIEPNNVNAEDYPDPAVFCSNLSWRVKYLLSWSEDRWLFRGSSSAEAPYTLVARHFEARDGGTGVEVSVDIFRDDDPTGESRLDGAVLKLPDGGELDFKSSQAPDGTVYNSAALSLPEELGSHNYRLVATDTGGGTWEMPLRLRTRRSVDHWYTHGPLTGLPVPAPDRTALWRALAADPGGRIWVGTNRGVSVYESGSWTHTTGDGVLEGMVPCLLATGDGAVWAGLWSDLTGPGWLARTKDGGFERFDLPGDGWGRVSALAEDRDGSLLVAYEHSEEKRFSLVRWSDGAFETIAVPEEHASSAAASIAVSKDGALWFGTNLSGVLRLKAGSWDRFTTFELDPQTASTLEKHFAFIAAAIGARIPLSSVRVPGTTIPLGALIPSKEDFVTRVHALAGGRVLVGSMGGGFRLLSPEGTVEKRLTLSDGIPHGYMPAFAQFAGGRGGSVWIPTDKGVARFLSDGRVERFTPSNGLFDLKVNGVTLDAEGQLWAAHQRGISVRKADGAAPFGYGELDKAQAALRDALRFFFTWQSTEGAALFFVEEAVEDVVAAYKKELARGAYVNPFMMSEVTWQKRDDGSYRASGRLRQEQKTWTEDLLEAELGRMLLLENPEVYVDLEDDGGRWKLSGDLKSASPFALVVLASTPRPDGLGRRIHLVASSDADLGTVTLSSGGESVEMDAEDKNKFSATVDLLTEPGALTVFEPFIFAFHFADGSEQTLEYRYDGTVEYRVSRP